MVFRAFLTYLMQLCVLVVVALPVQAGHLDMEEMAPENLQVRMSAEMPKCGMMCEMSAAECALHLQCADHKIVQPFAFLKSDALSVEFNLSEKRLLSLSVNPTSPPPRFV